MSNILTDWRQALVTYLDANLQSGDFDVRAGRRDGVSRDKKLACVFVPAIVEDSGSVNFARPPMMVRAWIPKPKQPPGESPHDPEPLEQLAIDLMEILEPVQTSLLAGLYFRVASVQIDYEDWGVQATLTSWMVNPATVAV